MIRASKNSAEISSREPHKVLRRAQAAQGLQGRDRLWHRGLVTDAGRESDLSVLRYSQLGGAARCAPVNNRISSGADSRLGV